MNVKVPYSGGEPNISMPDLLWMQYGNFDAIKGIVEGLSLNKLSTNPRFTISGVNPSVNASVLSVEKGYVFINDTVCLVEEEDIAYTVGNYYYLVHQIVYNTIGDKTFDDSTFHRTTYTDKAVLIETTSPVTSDSYYLIYYSGDGGDVSVNLKENMLDVLSASTAEAEALSSTSTFITPSTLGDVTGGLKCIKATGTWNTSTISNFYLTVTGMTEDNVRSVQVKVYNTTAYNTTFLPIYDTTASSSDPLIDVWMDEIVGSSVKLTYTLGGLFNTTAQTNVAVEVIAWVEV